jgi:Epoxide hydrolase N terminus
MADEVTEFRIEVPEVELERLRVRLRRVRWPERETVDDWSQGVPLAYMRDLCGYWADTYDWRATEARLNNLPQYRTVIDGLGIQGAPASVPTLGGEAVPGHPLLERARPGRTLCRLRAARTLRGRGSLILPARAVSDTACALAPPVEDSS